MPRFNAPTAQEKKRGMMVFAGLMAVSLILSNALAHTWKVVPPADSSREPYEAAFYRKMAYRGDAGAMFLIGMACRDGRGITSSTPKDLIEAHKWFNLAASRASAKNYPGYADARETVARSMTPQQVAEAQKRAREWLAAFEKDFVALR